MVKVRDEKIPMWSRNVIYNKCVKKGNLGARKKRKMAKEAEVKFRHHGGDQKTCMNLTEPVLGPVEGPFVVVGF